VYVHLRVDAGAAPPTASRWLGEPERLHVRRRGAVGVPSATYTSHPNERADRLTPLDLTEHLLPALARAWTRRFGRPPACRVHALLAAQIALETGARLDKVHNFNVGNAKSGITNPHAYFACTEDVSPARFASLRRDPRWGPLVEFVSTRLARRSGSIPTPIVTARFRPPHPTCRFRAFDSLDAGVDAHFALLQGKFRGAWPALEGGDAHAFVAALRRAGYFTGPLEAYQRGVAARQRDIMKRLGCAEAPGTVVAGLGLGGAR
jgi:hypothetical protein